MLRSVLTRAIAGVVLAAGLLTACSGGSTPAPSGSGASPSHNHSASVSGSGGTGSVGSASEAMTGLMPSPSSPVDVAVDLEELLGEHGILAADMMRSRIRGDADLAQVANSALTENTSALASLLKPVLGAPATQQFGQLWSAHVQALFNYARGLASSDAGVQATARKQLTGYETGLAGLFASHSAGRVSSAAALGLVQMHINHLLDGADAYAAKNYSAAASLYRESYEHTYDMGSTLVHGLLPASVVQTLDTPSVVLRSSLTKLMCEHVALVIAGMRAAVGDPRDFSAIGTAVNANTQALTSAIDSLFGGAAAQGFQSRWADHVDALIAYTSATVKQDTAAQQTQRVALRAFEQSMATFLNTATQNRIGQRALAQALGMHDRMLLAEIDAYATKNYDQAHELSNQTYRDMYSMAAQLSSAIGATLAGKLPKGGSQTGGGGMASVIGSR